MERRRNTRPGVLQWTPAPLWISPATSVTPEDSWEDEEEDPKVDGFVKQMDENGIIGLSEALEDLKLEEACGYSGPSITEEAVPSGGGGLKARTEDWIARQSENDHGRHFVMTEEEDEDHQGSKITRKRNEVPHTSAELEAREGLANCRFDRNPSENSNPDHLVSEPAVTASFLPHLYRFPEEELTAALGIEAETFPDMGFTETDSYCSQASVKSSPRCPVTKPRASPLPTDVFCEEVELKDIPKRVLEKQKAGHSSEATCSLGGAKKDSLKLKQPSNGPDRKHPAGMNEFRASTSRHTPDFSKVEPRVHFPKRGYNPPRRKSSLTRTPVSAEPPMVFKSPADIVKEVLFNAPTDGSSASADSNAPADVPNSMVPPEFMCPQQAMILLQQLQENYKKLLTKNAEAENTIDRLRLEAKVNLFSDPPKAGHFVHSGTSQHASNLLNLDFSPAQRAHICSHGQSSQQEKANPSPSTSRLGQQLSNLLFSQSEKFLQQLQTFDDLLKRDKLTSFEKLKGISQLSEGLNSLERGFLLARDEHKLLQQRGAETCNFDPER
ncbi:PREDICTED: AT-hook-containing transcription factor [Cyprinodon variegatus]|uniref:AT-hook-containing transcription factor n=1 Tax=Cyprinodon variegatus TaxID=28743 RepID=UPI0007427F26|nr:PREDICTED: AT-hook-containing transcription factor [Cyprinodon variegatus]